MTTTARAYDVRLMYERVSIIVRYGERVIVSAQVTATEHKQLQALAREADRSLSAEIRRALREHLEQAERSDREA